MGKNMAANAPKRTADPETPPHSAAFHIMITPSIFSCFFSYFLLILPKNRYSE
jgi:hypothetical protein